MKTVINRNAKFVTILLLFTILTSSVFSETNVSILYGWNGTAFGPVNIESDGSLKTTLNLSESIGIYPKDDSLYNLGSSSLKWLTGYFANVSATQVCIGADCRQSWPAGGGSAWDISTSVYLFNNSNILDVNETKLNETIDALDTNVSLQYGHNGTDWIGLKTTPGGILKFQVDNTSYLAKDGDTATGDYTFDSGTLFIDSSNDRVGIGTASPTHELHVVGDANITGTVYAHNFSGNSDITFINSTGDELVTIKEDGKVGIGTTGPNSRLHINNTGSQTGLYIENVDNPNEVALVAKAGGGGTAAIASFQNSSGNEMMKIQANGKVGIGTTSPNRILHVVGSTSGMLSLDNTATGGDKWTFYSESVGAYSSSLQIYNEDTDIYAFYSAPDSSTGMFMTPEGNVGIGTTSPTSGKLQISNPDSASDLDAIYVDNNEANANTYGLSIQGNSAYGIYLGSNADDDCYESGVGGTCSLNDYAEMMEFSELPGDGEVIIIDTENPGQLKVSQKPYDKLVAGISSEEPAMVIGSYGITIKGWDKNNVSRDGYYTYPLAISGRKRIKVTDENGEIRPGDLLVTSSEPGKAMRCEIEEIIIGEPLKESQKKMKQNDLCKNTAVAKAMTSVGGDRKVLALITLQ